MRSVFTTILANPLGLFGAILATVSFAASTLFLILQILREEPNPYQGILAYGVFPAFLFLGLFLTAVGGIVERRRKRRGFPIVDLNDPRQRRKLFVVAVAASIFAMLSVIGGYQAFEFTESVTFCGEVCHQVMEPEHTAYLNSPHARVTCVECHVGSGAQWFVKAKISGLYQVYAVLANTYPRPIPTPIEDLRPAQDTCGRCHWPDKFWGAQLAQKTHFSFDVTNTRKEVLMLVKTGGGGSAHGPSEGIHWHMNIANRIDYIHTDPRRMDIAWVRVTRPDGTTKEYVNSENPLDPRSPPEHPMRRMDCMDCHNRPSHTYLSPSEVVDKLLALGRIDARIPFLKTEATEVLAAEYETREEASRGIADGLVRRYQEKHPEAARRFRREIDAAIPELEALYRQNFFPEMKVRWSAYPSHISHKEFPGCFRCHTEEMRDEEGTSLSSDCTLCHTFVARGVDGASFEPLPADPSLYHPWGQAGAHASMKCWSCHTGAASPYGTCGSCHEIDPKAPMSFSCATCHQASRAGEAMDCSRCHAVGGSRLHAMASHRTCADCHEAHAWRPEDPRDCTRACHSELAPTHYPDGPCASCHDFKGVTSGFGTAPLPPSVRPQLGGGPVAPPHAPAGGAEETPGTAGKYAGKGCLEAGCHLDMLARPVVHGPVASASCDRCHRKTSDEEHRFELLVAEEDVCVTCHVLPGPAKLLHKPYEQKACLSCHDPHGGADGALLVEESLEATCLQCHARPQGTLHAPVEEGKCSACHRAHESDEPKLLSAPEKDLCTGCHADVKDRIADAAMVHKPVANGCAGCHVGHSSPNHALLARSYPPELYAPFTDDAYALCSSPGCHVREIIEAPRTRLTQFRDGDRNLHHVHVRRDEKGRTCRACHESHAADGPKLMRESIPFGPGGWPLPIGFRPTPTGGACASGCHQALSYDRENPVSES